MLERLPQPCQTAKGLKNEVAVCFFQQNNSFIFSSIIYVYICIFIQSGIYIYIFIYSLLGIMISIQISKMLILGHKFAQHGLCAQRWRGFGVRR